MEITGRIVADAKINKLTDGREVTGFTLVQNDHFKTKAGESKQVATFFKCAYWVSPKVADHLKKGTIITVYGRIGLDVYKDQQGEAKGSITIHVNDIKFIANGSRETETVSTPKGALTTKAQNTNENKDDLPF